MIGGTNNMANNIKKWELEDQEIALYAPKHGPASESPLKVIIPKLCPLINSGLPKNNPPTSISTSCYANASDCKPIVSSTINTRNYLELEMMPNQQFKKDHFWKNDKMIVEIRNKNIYDMKITNRLDNSHEALPSCPQDKELT